MIDLIKKPKPTFMTPLKILYKNGWWDHGVDRIITIKKQIEKAEKAGLKKITVPTIINSHAIAYFESFGMKLDKYNTIEGTHTDIQWE